MSCRPTPGPHTGFPSVCSKSYCQPRFLHAFPFLTPRSQYPYLALTLLPYRHIWPCHPNTHRTPRPFRVGCYLSPTPTTYPAEPSETQSAHSQPSTAVWFCSEKSKISEQLRAGAGLVAPVSDPSYSGWLRQVDHELMANLGFSVRSCLKRTRLTKT